MIFSKYDASLKVILDTPEQAFVKLCKEIMLLRLLQTMIMSLMP